MSCWRQAIASLVLIALAGATSGCHVKPWPIHATVESTKPESPVRAPPDAALVVVAIVQAQGDGNGGYTVFESSERVIAQFPESVAGWSMTPVPPGQRRLYVRTWTSEFCRRIDVRLEPGKVYVLTLNGDAGGGGPMALEGTNIEPRAAFVRPEPGTNPGGALHLFPFVRLDAAAASAELAKNRDQVETCVAKANEAFATQQAVHEGGFDEIGFTVPK